MYDYRKMSDEEKRQILEFRKQRKYPYHRPPHLDLGKGVYLITSATFEHIHYFNEPKELSALELRILDVFSKVGFVCHCWVILPNHYHVLLDLENPKDFGKVIAPVHRKSALYCNKRDKVFNRKIWYKYSDRKIRSERHFWASISYILNNSLKHGLIDNPENWPWSNYKDFTEKQITDIKSDYNLEDYGKGWDDF